MIRGGRKAESLACRQTGGRRSAARGLASRLLRLSLRAAGPCFLAVLLAVFFAAAALAQTPDPKQLFQEAYAAQQSGDAKEAADRYQKLLSQYPDMTAAHANLGVVFASLGRFDDAITQYHIALAEAPGDPSLRLNLGLAYYKKGDLAGAAAEFASLHKDSPDDLRVTTLLANCQVELGLDAQTIAMLTPIEKAHPDNVDIEWALGSALIHVGRTREGLERVQKYAEQRKSARAYSLAADYYFGLTHFNKAKSDAEEALRLDPNLAKAHVVLGLVANYSGKAELAEKEFRKALEMDPNDLQARVQLASVLYLQRKLKEARQEVTRALALSPDLPSAFYILARVDRAEGNLKGALSNLQKAEKQRPQWLLPHIELAALYYQMKQPAEGARERKIVDQIRATERERQGATRIILPRVP